MHRHGSEGFVFELDIDLLEQTAEADVDGSIDDHADHPVFAVFADQRQRFGKIRVCHAGHGDQKMIGKIDAVH